MTPPLGKGKCPPAQAPVPDAPASPFWTRCPRCGSAVPWPYDPRVGALLDQLLALEEQIADLCAAGEGMA
jgi:hypothetical protein